MEEEGLFNALSWMWDKLRCRRKNKVEGRSREIRLFGSKRVSLLLYFALLFAWPSDTIVDQSRAKGIKSYLFNFLLEILTKMSIVKNNDGFWYRIIRSIAHNNIVLQKLIQTSLFHMHCYTIEFQTLLINVNISSTPLHVSLTSHLIFAHHFSEEFTSLVSFHYTRMHASTHTPLTPDVLKSEWYEYFVQTQHRKS